MLYFVLAKNYRTCLFGEIYNTPPDSNSEQECSMNYESTPGEAPLNYKQKLETCANYSVLKLPGANPIPFLVAAY